MKKPSRKDLTQSRGLTEPLLLSRENYKSYNERLNLKEGIVMFNKSRKSIDDFKEEIVEEVKKFIGQEMDKMLEQFKKEFNTK